MLKPRDLCGIDLLEELLMGGINCFKIQGRTRNIDYLSNVVKVYKRYLEQYETKKECVILSKDKKILKESYPRGLSGGNLQIQRNSNLTVNETVNENEVNTLKKFKEKSFVIATGKKCNISAHILLHKLNKNDNYELLYNKIDKLYIPFEYFLDMSYEQVINCLCHSFDICVYTPGMIYERNCTVWYKELDFIISKFHITGIIISNISDFVLIERYKGLGLEFIGNYTLNVMNHYTADAIKEMGVSMTTLSVEMNQSECNDLISKTKIKSGVIVYGHIPMMRMKYCLLKKCNECMENCSQPCKSEDIYRLAGEDEYIVDISAKQTTTTLYCKKKLFQSLSLYKVHFFRTDFYDETVNQMIEMIDHVKKGNYFIGRDYVNHWNIQ